MPRKTVQQRQDSGNAQPTRTDPPSAEAEGGSSAGEVEVPPVMVEVDSAVLLVDDDAGVRHAVARLLKTSGLHVVTARNGAEALELFDRDPSLFGLLLTDVMMPGMSGIELVREVSQRKPNLRVVVMSGHENGRSVQRALPNVETTFLRKPFSPSVLREALPLI